MRARRSETLIPHRVNRKASRGKRRLAMYMAAVAILTGAASQAMGQSGEWQYRAEDGMCMAILPQGDLGEKVTIASTDDPNIVIVEISNSAWKLGPEKRLNLSIVYYDNPSRSDIKTSSGEAMLRDNGGRRVIWLTMGVEFFSSLYRRMQFQHEGKEITGWLKISGFVKSNLMRCHNDPF